MNCWVNFLPPYCPHLAPVELFFKILKTKIRANYTDEVINFEGDTERDWNFQALLTINKTMIQKIMDYICETSKTFNY